MERLKKLLASDLIQSDLLRRLVPGPVKQVLKRRIPYADYRSEQLRREAERRLGGEIPGESDFESPYDATLGIIADNSYTFTYNIAACRELKVRFRVVDITASDWVKRVRDSGCSAFLATPATLLGIWHRMYEERLWVMAHDLRVTLCPTYEELFLWESKRRMRDWLTAHEVPHPETWVFFERDPAMEFCSQAEFPLVCKTDSGAASSGIFVLRDQRSAEAMVKQAFTDGILARSSDPREREWGSVIFQEYVPHEYEWRIVRIGNDFMCRRKVRAGDFASGSGDIGWAAPLPGMLDFAKHVTDIGGFSSMSLDMFQNKKRHDGTYYLVNELQAIIGFREVKETEQMGRWTHCDAGSWSFEFGRYHGNCLANLRVELLLKKVAIKEKNMK